MRIDNFNNLKPITIHNVYLLDSSGSMSTDNKYYACIEAIKEEVNKLKELYSNEIEYTFSLFTFDKIYSEFKDVLKLDFNKFRFNLPLSMTPLYDSIGNILERINENIKPEDRVIFTICTDGEENASKSEYKNLEYLQEAMSKYQKENNITYTFIASSDDKDRIINTLNIPEGNIVTHNNTAESLINQINFKSEMLENYSNNTLRGMTISTSYFTGN